MDSDGLVELLAVYLNDDNTTYSAEVYDTNCHSTC